MIPKQLKSKHFRFILIGRDKKLPMEKGWQIEKNYTYDDPVLKRHIRTGHNYGVATGFNKLIVLDFDSREAYDKIRKMLPDTFTVLSASKKLPHAYYFVECDSPKAKGINDENNVRLIDIQGQKRQVVAPGSMIGENKYTVWRDVPISTINYVGLMNLMDQMFPKKVEQIENKPVKAKSSSGYDVDVCASLSVRQVAQRLGSTFIKSHHGNCPLDHSSVGGVCFHVNEANDQVWYCFDCCRGGNVLNLVQYKFGCTPGEAMNWLKKEFKLGIKDVDY